MKKNAFLLPLLVLAMALIGCKPTPEKNSDTGSDDVAGSAGKSLVKKMVVTAAYTDTAYDEEYDGSATLNFAYEEGRLASITGTGEYVYRYMDYSEPDPVNPEGNAKAEESVWMEDKTSGTATVGFTYDGEKVNVSLSMDATYDEAGYGPEHYSGTGTMALQMNADKAVSSARSKFVSEEESSDELLVNFEYSNEYLQYSVIPYDNEQGYAYGNAYEWSDGNLVRMGSHDDYTNKKSGAETSFSLAKMSRLFFPLSGVWAKNQGFDARKDRHVHWDLVSRMEYTTQENKSNVDFAFLTWLCYEGAEDPAEFLGALGFTGKMSKNLPLSLYEYATTDDFEIDPNERYEYGHVEYTFNDQDLVTHIRVLGEEGELLGTISFEY